MATIAQALDAFLAEQRARLAMFLIEGVESGKLWLAGVTEPVAVPTAASDLAREGWSVTATIARTGGRWRFVEIGNVYP